MKLASRLWFARIISHDGQDESEMGNDSPFGDRAEKWYDLSQKENVMWAWTAVAPEDRQECRALRQWNRETWYNVVSRGCGGQHCGSMWCRGCHGQDFDSRCLEAIGWVPKISSYGSDDRTFSIQFGSVEFDFMQRWKSSPESFSKRLSIWMTGFPCKKAVGCQFFSDNSFFYWEALQFVATISHVT